MPIVVTLAPSSLRDDDVTNMSKVDLHDDFRSNCSSNISTYRDPRCDTEGNGISLLMPLSMMILGVMGNIIALAVIYSSRQETQGRRTVFFVMLAGLAWSDLTAQFCVSTVPNLVYFNNLKWVGGIHLCRYHGFGMTTFGLIMPLVISCMSFERFLAIRFSYFYARHITQRKAQGAFLMCIVVALIFSSFPFFGFGSYELQYPGSWCFLNFHRESVIDSVYATMFSSINILAILVMLFCNISVVITLFIMRRNRKVNNSPSYDRRISVSQISNSGGAVIRSRKHSDMEAQMIWFLCLITIAFSVCWLPFNVYVIINQFSNVGNHVLDLLFIRMLGWNQILDPWLYVIFRKSSFLRALGYVKRFLHIKRRTSDDLLNEAMRNQDLRKRSRTSTMEVSAFNRTLGTGTSRGNINMEENLENLKKILEAERKLGREMYSRISEKTETSESNADGTTSGVCSRNASVKEITRYDSMKSRDKTNESAGGGQDGETGHAMRDEDVMEFSDGDEMRYDDIVIDADICPGSDNAAHRQHRPCTNTKSCPVPGSEPMVATTVESGMSSSSSSSRPRPIVGKQLSMPARPFPPSIEEENMSLQLTRPSTTHGSFGTVNGHRGCSSTTSVHSGGQCIGHRLPRDLDLVDLQAITDDDVFENDELEAAILLCGDNNKPKRKSQTGNNSTSTGHRSGSYSNGLAEGSASDSQGLLS